jgi:hypothetical protein
MAPWWDSDGAGFEPAPFSRFPEQRAHANAEDGRSGREFIGEPWPFAREFPADGSLGKPHPFGHGPLRYAGVMHQRADPPADFFICAHAVMV